MTFDDEWLPIGSVVILENADFPCMIIGRMVKKNEADHVWDYAACAYPIGVVPNEGFLLFMKKGITKVLHVGFLSEVEERLVQEFGTYGDSE